MDEVTRVEFSSLCYSTFLKVLCQFNQLTMRPDTQPLPYICYALPGPAICRKLPFCRVAELTERSILETTRWSRITHVIRTVSVYDQYSVRGNCIPNPHQQWKSHPSMKSFDSAEVSTQRSNSIPSNHLINGIKLNNRHVGDEAIDMFHSQDKHVNYRNRTKYHVNLMHRLELVLGVEASLYCIQRHDLDSTTKI